MVVTEKEDTSIDRLAKTYDALAAEIDRRCSE
jgi:hypothetical protein